MLFQHSIIRNQNEDIHRDLQIPLVRQEIQESIARYKKRLKKHPNGLTEQLLAPRTVGRLKCRVPADFVT